MSFGRGCRTMSLWNVPRNSGGRPMSRPRKSLPSYLEHKRSGKGRLVWTDTLGIRHEKLLPGLYQSSKSLAAKARLELELATSPTQSAANQTSITVNEVLLSF